MTHKSESRNSRGVGKFIDKTITLVFLPKAESVQSIGKNGSKVRAQNWLALTAVLTPYIILGITGARNSDLNALYTILNMKQRSTSFMKH